MSPARLISIPYGSGFGQDTEREAQYRGPGLVDYLFPSSSAIAALTLGIYSPCLSGRARSRNSL